MCTKARGSCWCRCSCWRSARSSPAMLAEHWFVGDGRGEFWKHAILVLPQHDSIAAAEHVPASSSILPLIAGCSASRSPISAIRSSPRSPARLAMQFRALYLFLLNKWYFDELYDRLFVRTAFSLGEGLWKTGDGDDHRRARPRRHRRRDPRTGARGQPAADRLCLPLRLRHADRRRRAGHLVPAAAVSATARGQRRELAWGARLGRSCRSSPSCRWSASCSS